MKKNFLVALILAVVLGLPASVSASPFDHQNQPTGVTCCFTSAAMLATNLVGKQRDTFDIRSQFSRYGGLTGGADWRLMPAVGKTYNLYVEHYGMESAGDTQSAADRRKVKEGLKRAEALVGYDVMAIVIARGRGRHPFRSSIFTAKGHCMVLYDFVRGKFKLSNPNPRTPQGRFSTRDLIHRGNIVAVWLYYKNV